GRPAAGRPAAAGARPGGGGRPAEGTAAPGRRRTRRWRRAGALTGVLDQDRRAAGRIVYGVEQPQRVQQDLREKEVATEYTEHREYEDGRGSAVAKGESSMRRGLFLSAAVVVLCASVAAQNPPAGRGGGPPAPTGPHIYIRAGLKTHGPGQHDYPQFLADWSKVLTERNALVDGSLHFPKASELDGVDVLVMYK